MQKTILCVCIYIILISIFFVLIPNKNMESVMKFTLNLFLISIIVVPLISNIKKIDFSQYKNILNKNQMQSYDLEEKVLENNKKNLKNALEIVFFQNGYKDLDISIDINKDSQTTNISIKIPSEKNYSRKEIEKITKQQTGITPKIEYI